MTLRAIQVSFGRFIADSDASVLLDTVDGSASEAADRLDIFRNNSLVTHTTVLAAVFPVVCRLVDPRFFAFMAHEFLRESPPQHPCLSQYGEAFPAFVARFSRAAAIPYLYDVARLEWAISRVPTAPRMQPIPIAQFAARMEDPAAARLLLESPVYFIRSEFPIDMVWDLNQSRAVIDRTLLDARGAYLQVRGGRSPPWSRLERADWTFRSLVSGGTPLGVAAEETLRLDVDFDLARALAALFSEGLVVGCA